MSQRRRRAVPCRVEELEGRVAPSIVVTHAVLDTRHPHFIALNGYTTNPTGGGGRSLPVLTIYVRQAPVGNKPQIMGYTSSIQLERPTAATPAGATGAFRADVYAQGSTWDMTRPQIDVQSMSTDTFNRNAVVETSQQNGLHLQLKA
jgi:hypothetical protein